MSDKVITSMYIPKEYKEIVDRVAKERKVSKSELYREIITLWLQVHGYKE